MDTELRLQLEGDQSSTVSGLIAEADFSTGINTCMADNSSSGSSSISKNSKTKEDWRRDLAAQKIQTAVMNRANSSKKNANNASGISIPNHPHPLIKQFCPYPGIVRMMFCFL